MDVKLLNQSPCSIMHYSVDPTTGEVAIIRDKDGIDHSCDVVQLSLKTCYKICYANLCSGFPREMITRDFSHYRSITLSVPLRSGLRYCVRIRLL